MIFLRDRILHKTSFSKRFLPYLFSVIFITCFSLTGLKAQVVPEIPDINPEALKNASPSQLQDYLKDKNQNLQNPGEDIHQKLSKLKANSAIVKDSTQKDDYRKKVNGPEDVYGSDLFQNRAVVELAELSTPPPDYPIGVGDHIVVSLWGGADFEIDYIVARDGSIFPQGLGKITVQGLTFENARNIIKNRFQKVTPPSTNVSVSMGQPRSIVVNVSGEVVNKGPVVVSAFTNALNVIALAGGMTPYGNLRTIYIRRSGRVIDSLDIYKYLTTGDFGRHLYLENNDFIIVPVYDKKVLASGQFKRPMYYQLKQKEGYSDLLRYSGGLTSDAYASGGIIIRNVDEKQTIRNVNFNAIGLKAGNMITDEPLYNGDVVVIRAINQGLTNKVVVKGEIAYPNVYEIRKGDRLFDVINRAGGVTANAYLERAYVYKGAGDSANLKSDKIDVSLKDLNKNINSSFNIPIDPNDVIEVFNRNQFFDKQTVSIEGEVRVPKTMQRYGGMTLKDLIYFANGLKPSAEFGRIEISSILDIDSAQKGLKPTKIVVRSYSIMPNLELDSLTERIKLKPYDQVFVRKNPSFQMQQNIIMDGQVVYPGTYTRLDKFEHLSSYIARAGGLRENANENGAILYRNKSIGTRQLAGGAAVLPIKYIKDSTGKIIDSVIYNPNEPVSIDLDKALKFKNSKYDLILQEGDIIFVPEVNPIVSVKGIVQQQLKIYFDKEHTNLSYYIDKAGGFGVHPWRKRIYVTYSNGKSQRTRNFGFLHFYPKVEEGSIIVVPVRPAGSGVVDFAQQTLQSITPVVLSFLLFKYL